MNYGAPMTAVQEISGKERRTHTEDHTKNHSKDTENVEYELPQPGKKQGDELIRERAWHYPALSILRI